MASPPGPRISPDASPDEAAAIAAAIEAVLATEASDDTAEDGTDAADPWAGRRFAFAGRVAKLGNDPVRPSDGAPANPWTAAGRIGRF